MSDVPVSTEPGCLHPGCVLEHPHAGPAMLKEAVPDAGVAKLQAHARGTVTPAEGGDRG